jgi:aspartyl-tRNA(Asn)/glutamyl-tRNA(Gln) amidotransferase subunit A
MSATSTPKVPRTATDAGIAYAGIRETSESIRRQRVSPVEVTRNCLARIEALNPRVNAFITVLADEAIEQAEIAAAEIGAGRWRGPLHGIPVGIKDMFDTAGVRTTAAFEGFRDRVPAKDAATVRKLKDAGAVVIGKTNMHRLAMGTTSAVSAFGPVHNPWNRDFIAGGSSGGSAAAVASGMCFATLDTDAIGSCRLPASCCGVTGFKGTYGLISNEGVLAGEPVDATILWLAHAAITTRAVEDAALVLNILAGPASGSLQGRDYLAATEGDEELRIGLVRSTSASMQAMAAFDAAGETLGNFGPLREVATRLDSPGFDVRNIEADRQAVAGSLFSHVDVLVSPTTAAPTPTIEDAAANPLALSAENTLFANYYGLPAISTPCGFDHNGLPLGLQIVGKPGDDQTVLRLARRFQAATAWSGMHPMT